MSDDRGWLNKGNFLAGQIDGSPNVIQMCFKSRTLMSSEGWVFSLFWPWRVGGYVNQRQMHLESGIVKSCKEWEEEHELSGQIVIQGYGL